MRERVIFKINIDPGVNNLQVDIYIASPPQVGQYVIRGTVALKEIWKPAKCQLISLTQVRIL
jgi:hypothetical protein